jgi:uncharacterized membrane protein
MKKLLIALVALFVLSVIPAAMAAVSVDINGASTTPVSVIRGDTIPVMVTFSEPIDYKDVTVEVQLRYEHSKKVEASTKAIDVVAGTTYTRTLSIDVPSDIEITAPGNYYSLTVVLKDGNGYELEAKSFDLMVQRTDDQLQIQKVLKSQTIEAGNTFTADVVVKNTGSDQMNDVYVRMSIPELGLATEGRVGDLVSVDSATKDDTNSVRLSLNVPADTANGSYSLELKAYQINSDAWTTLKDTVVVGNPASDKDNSTVAKEFTVDPLLVTAVILAIVLVVLVIVFVKTRKGGEKLEEESYY